MRFQFSTKYYYHIHMYNQLKNSDSYYPLQSPRKKIYSSSSRKNSLKVKLPKNSKLAPFFSPLKQDPPLIIEGHSKKLHQNSPRSNLTNRSSAKSSHNKILPLHSRVQSQKMNEGSKKDLLEDNSKTRSRITIFEEYGFPLEMQNRKKSYMSPKTPKVIPLKSLQKKQKANLQYNPKCKVKTDQEVGSPPFTDQRAMEFTFGLQNCFSVKKL